MTDTTPTSVRIGPFTYAVGPIAPMDSTKHGNFGWHHWPSLEIRYRADVNVQQKAQIILHEILHGIWYTNRLDKDEDDRAVEEGYVEQLAISLCDFIRNNPEMIAWISQTLAGDGESSLTVKNQRFEANITAQVKARVEVADKTVYVNDKPTLWA